MRLGRLTAGDVERVRRLLLRAGLPVQAPRLGVDGARGYGGFSFCGAYTYSEWMDGADTSSCWCVMPSCYASAFCMSRG